MKSVADCLGFIDNMILINIEKSDSIESSESMRDYFLDDYFEKSDEELVAIMSVLSQINLIKHRFYIPNEYCITNYHYDLRKRTLAWLKTCNKQMENDNHQITLLSKTSYSDNAPSIFSKS